MLAFALGLGSFLMCLFLCFVVLCWIAQQVSQAAKYRRLVHLAQAQPSKPEAGGGWVVNYMERGKRKTVNIDGATEQEVLKKAVLQGIGYDKIMSVIKG